MSAGSDSTVGGGADPLAGATDLGGQTEPGTRAGASSVTTSSAAGDISVLSTDLGGMGSEPPTATGGGAGPLTTAAGTTVAKPTDPGSPGTDLSSLGTDLGTPVVPQGVGAPNGRITHLPTDLGEAKPPDTPTGGKRFTDTKTDVETIRGKTRVGLYEVLEELGRGGMGAVYRAWHAVRRKYVALKIIKSEGASDAKFAMLRDLFMREGAILMAVQHENVVACYDANEALHEGKPALFMALELLEGKTLQDKLTAKPLSPDEAISIGRSLARALQALHEHEKRILHRDIKPANVFITRDGVVKLLDFGLAALTDWRLEAVSIFAAGSRPYMSPEQFDGLRACTERSDLYSLGVTLFHAVAGRTPFEEQNDQGYYNAHRKRSPPTLLEANPKLEATPKLEAVQNIVTKLLAKDPAERYQSATELLEALDTVDRGGTILVPEVTRPETVRLRRQIMAAVGVVLLFVAVWFGSIQVAKSGITKKLAEVSALRNALRFDEALAALTPVYELNAEDPAVSQAFADVTGAIEARRRLSDRRAAAAKQANVATAAGELRDVRKQAGDSTAFSQAELAEIDRELAEAEAKLAAAEKVRTIETERERAERERIEAAKTALQKDLLDATNAVNTAVRDAEQLLATDLERAIAGFDVVREMLEKRGPELEAASGHTASQIAERTLEPRRLVALKKAEAALKDGRWDDAVAHGMASLKSLGGAARNDLARLARAYIAAATSDERAARRQLRKDLAGTPPERAWLIVEHAAAERGRTPTERLVRRLDDIELGSEDPVRKNGRHGFHAAPFYIDTAEVTCGPYAGFLAASGGVKAPDGWTGRQAPAGSEAIPVAGVSFVEAKAYAAWAGKRLPLADEWEIAASVVPAAPGGARRPYPWGDLAPEKVLEFRELAKAGAATGDASPWGCLDMGGSVQEWTIEAAEGEEIACQQGGSYKNGGPRFKDSFFAAFRRRPKVAGDYRFPDAGFRCARDTPAPDLAELAR